jgi:uncharacterized protein YndB with AHSA1/START domain
MTMTSKPEYVYVTYIQSTPETVWNALFDKELTKLYWGLGKNVSDWKAGSKWEHRDYETEEVRTGGEVIEIDAPKKLVMTWDGKKFDEPPSKVTILVENQFGAVKLTVIHEQLGPKMYEGISQGWPAVLSSLKTLLESGQPMPMTTRRWGR